MLHMHKNYHYHRKYTCRSSFFCKKQILPLRRKLIGNIYGKRTYIYNLSVQTVAVGMEKKYLLLWFSFVLLFCIPRVLELKRKIGIISQTHIVSQVLTETAKRYSMEMAMLTPSYFLFQSLCSLWKYTIPLAGVVGKIQRAYIHLKFPFNLALDEYCKKLLNGETKYFFGFAYDFHCSECRELGTEIYLKSH